MYTSDQSKLFTATCNPPYISRCPALKRAPDAHKVRPRRVNLDMSWYNGCMLHRNDLNVGDIVTWTSREQRFEGRVTKFNPMTIKVEQTNDASYHTRPAFGNSGRVHGGLGTVWTWRPDSGGCFANLGFAGGEKAADAKLEAGRLLRKAIRAAMTCDMDGGDILTIAAQEVTK